MKPKYIYIRQHSNTTNGKRYFESSNLHIGTLDPACYVQGKIDKNSNNYLEYQLKKVILGIKQNRTVSLPYELIKDYLDE